MFLRTCFFLFLVLLPSLAVATVVVERVKHTHDGVVLDAEVFQ